MGCTSSSTRLFDVYEELCRRTALTQDDLRTKTPAGSSILRRSNAFACIDDGNSKDCADAPKATEERPYLPAPTAVSITALLAYSEKQWQLRSVRPLSSFAGAAVAEAINASQGNKGSTDLRRVHYRLWMMALVELYHGLAVLQDCKALPSDAVKWLRKAEKLPPSYDRDGDGARAALTDSFRAIQLKALSGLKPKVLARLATEFPDAFQGVHDPALGGTLTANDAPSVMQSVRCFHTASGRSPRAESNPLNRDPPNTQSIALGVFLEWLVLRQVLSLCGPEEDSQSYKLSPTDTAPLAVEEGPTPLNAAHRFASGWPASMMGNRDTASLAAWAEKLRRLDEIEEMMKDCSRLSDTERRSLQSELHSLLDDLHSLFSRLSGGTLRMGEAEASDAVFTQFGLHDAFATQEQHSDLSRVAFTEAAPQSFIGTDGAFRLYLAVYVQLFEMSHKARSVQHTDAADAILPLRESDFSHVLSGLSRAQMSVLDALADGCVDASADTQPFARLYSVLRVTDPGPDGMRDGVTFDSLCDCVSQAVAGSLALRELQQLRKALGLHKQAEESISCSRQFVEKCCSRTRLDGASAHLEKEFNESVCWNARLRLYVMTPNLSARAALQFTAVAVAVNTVKSLTTVSMASVVQQWLSELYATANTPSCCDGDANSAHSAQCYFLAHAVFTTTCVLRCADETQPSVVPADDASATSTVSSTAGTGGAPITLQTQLGRKWFDALVGQIAEKLGFTRAALLSDAGAILSARPYPQEDTASSGVPAARLYRRGKTPSLSSPVRREKLDGAAVTKAAFGELATVDHKAGMHGTTVELDALLYVCLFNATKAALGREPAFRGFFSLPFPYHALTALQKLLSALPLDDEAAQYREFFLCSGGQRSIRVVQATEGDDEASVTASTEEMNKVSHTIFMRYKDLVLGIIEDEATFQQWCMTGFLYLKGESGELFARDYGAVLEYLAGHFVAYAVHRNAVPSVRNASEGGDGRHSVRRRFVEEIVLFPLTEDTAEASERESASEVARRVFTELQLKEMNLRADCIDVPLDSVAVWYSEFRVVALTKRQSPLALWRVVARRVPYSDSLPHRRTRKDVAERLRHVQPVAVSADGTGRGVDEADNGYIPVDALTSICLEVIGREDVLVMPSFGSIENWLRYCVKSTNIIVGRADLGDTELHEQDLRPFFAFVHHSLAATGTLEELKQEQDAVRSLRAQSLLSENSNGAVETDAADQLRDAVLRCLREEMSSAQTCVDALTTRECACSYLDANGAIDTEGLAHHIAHTLVAHEHGCACRALAALREEREMDLMEQFEHDRLLGRFPAGGLPNRAGNVGRTGAGGDAKVAGMEVTYWMRLRYTLPHGSCYRQCLLRSSLWSRFDSSEKGYLSLSDLNRGLHDVLQLQEFREDLAPVLFRAFLATKEVSSTDSNVVYLTAAGEQYLTPREFRLFLHYMYAYMELYFMFDVLTCSGAVDHHLHLNAAAADPVLAVPDPMESSNEGVMMARGALPLSESAPLPPVVSEDPDTASSALCALASKPHDAMRESAAATKCVTLAQFEIARRLLYRWGVRVDDVEGIFRDINRRTREQGEMFFTGFAIWASERDLHPEGYGCDFRKDFCDREENDTTVALVV